MERLHSFISIALLLIAPAVHTAPIGRLTPEAPVHITKVAPLLKLPDLPAQPIAPIEPISEPVVSPQPAPTQAPTQAPTPTLSGCQTYFSGDFFLDNIIRYESGGDSCATNPGGCFGLLQACPGAPLRAACGGDPSCQIAWFQQYKTGGRSWAQVWQHELDFGWW